MKLTITTLFFALLALKSYGQETITVEYTADYRALINGQQIDNTTTYDDIVKLLGEPELYKAYPTGKRKYHYKELGIVLSTVEGNVLSIGFNYNWDGDKNFPETSFEGELKVGDIFINKSSHAIIIENLAELGINCPIPRMCMNNPKKIRNPILLGFENDEITQVSIEFH
ncbi:DUF7738 domain-containing protein [Fulvivirga sediminis]|uniref:DUF7738 domain-containing protein n=1 Tax=Fulvivirga sediminis TaxID=2803949 RepID=A0A937FD45_9BACT|nr:hypothetical protein [Fulvivirga sediminis]MBL3658710.1 hypothetical protein [Fulvivirga sediminis]